MNVLPSLTFTRTAMKNKGDEGIAILLLLLYPRCDILTFLHKAFPQSQVRNRNPKVLLRNVRAEK